MTKTQIIHNLKIYLSNYHINLILLALSLPNDITFCMTVSDIIKEYNSDQEDENIVSELLSRLCYLHFKPKK